MTPEEYNERMNSLINDLPEQHANLLISLASSANAIVKQRIQTSGTDANGSKFPAYSEWYQKYKTEKGKNKGFTDFSFTNRMWNNIQVINERSNGEVAVITAKDKGATGTNITVPVKAHKRKGKQIAATTKQIYMPSNYEKLEKNTKRFGEILNLSTEEKKLLAQDYDNGILDIFRSHGL